MAPENHDAAVRAARWFRGNSASVALSPQGHDRDYGAGQRPRFPAEDRKTAVSALSWLVIGALDVLCLALSAVLQGMFDRGPGVLHQGNAMALTVLGMSSLTLMVLAKAGHFTWGAASGFWVRIVHVSLAVTYATLAGMVCLALLPVYRQAWDYWPAYWGASTYVLLALACAAWSGIARSTTLTARSPRRIAVVGLNGFSATLVDRINTDPSGADSVVGVFHDPDFRDDGASDIESAGSLDDLVHLSRGEKLDAIVLAFPSIDPDLIARARYALRSVTVDIYMACAFLELACGTNRLDRIGPYAVLKLARAPMSRAQILQKRTFDYIVASILLVSLAPVLAVIALAVRIDSPGPVLFRQPRLGFNNKIFDVLKFRTMHHHMSDLTADRQTTRGDPRITRLGGILRRTSLDELPQVLNVLWGDMSLVGPRPHAPSTKAGNRLFHEVVSDYELRHRVRPGITGWAQVNGWRGETRTFEQIEQRVAHDLHYIENWSLWLDCKIMALTALREVNSKVAF